MGLTRSGRTRDSGCCVDQTDDPTAVARLAKDSRDVDAREDQVILGGEEQRLGAHHTALDPRLGSSGLDALAIQHTTGVRRETISGYLKAAGIPVRGVAV